MNSMANQSLLASRPSPMTPFLVLSVAGHGAMIALWLVLNWLYEHPRMDLDQQPIKASLVRLGKKRDEKLLPRKEPEPPPPAEEAKIPIPSPDAKPVDPKPKATAEKPVDKKKSLFDALNKTAKPEELEGAEDGDARGDSAVQEGERYYGILKAAIGRYYDVSNTIPESERIQLSADVVIRLDSEGRLLDTSLARKSSNDVFNEAVLAAVKRAAPFGPPPPHLREQLKKGQTIRFTPQ